MRERSVRRAGTAERTGFAALALLLGLATLGTATAAGGGVVPSDEPALSRDDEPVVITGSGLSALLGTPVGQVASLPLRRVVPGVRADPLPGR